MNQYKKHGFTLLEMTFVTAIFSLFILYVFQTIVSVTRVSMTESIQLDMDGNANWALNRISAYLRDAVLPIETLSTSGNPMVEVINSNKGFSDVSKNNIALFAGGTNFIPFCQFVDGDGSGDCIDHDKVPYLGIVRKDGGNNSQDGGAVHVIGGEYDSNYVLQDKINNGFDINWNEVKNRINKVKSLNVNYGNGAYAILRFAPYCGPTSKNRSNSSPVEVSMNDLKLTATDFDSLGITGVNPGKKYLIGTLETYYPQAEHLSSRTEPFTFPNNMILAPVSGASENNETFVQPIFTLVYVDDDGSVQPADNTKYNAIRVQLTMLNVQDSDFFSLGASTKYRTHGWNPVKVQKYETIIHLRSLSL